MLHFNVEKDIYFSFRIFLKFPFLGGGVSVLSLIFCFRLLNSMFFYFVAF